MQSVKSTLYYHRANLKDIPIVFFKNEKQPLSFALSFNDFNTLKFRYTEFYR